MAKGGNSLSSKRSRGAKPYDANNSFVKKVTTKVTDLIPQRSWISKWFNSSQNNGEMLADTENREDSENEQEEPAQPPPTKRPRIRMDVTHPPGTFDIQPRSRTLVNSDEVDPRKEQYPVHNETNDDFLEPPVAGTSGTRRLVASTPAIQPEIKTKNSQRDRANFISLTSSQNQNNGATNGTDDNSESSESTSGCSSLIPQVNRQEASSSLGYNRSFTNRKRYVDDKLNFTNHLQSPRSLFLDSNARDSLSSRRPSFNASVMSSSLERGPSFASPFYNGNTTFGGANTAGFQRRGRTLFHSVNNELQLKVPNRTNIQVKSPNAAGTDSSGMSQTAKRILEALEHFSSPILDAKKIPMNSNNISSSPIGGKKRPRNESGTPLARVGLRHLTRELTVPTVPDLLKLRRRQRLQDTTVVARKIVSARSAPPPSPQEYRLRSNDDEKSKYAGKVKAKDKADLEDDVIPGAVNLPNISLPISTLPTFDIMMPVITTNKGRGAKEELFKFASPIKVTDTSRNLKSINNFTFSEPIIANDTDSTDDSHTLSRTLTVDSNSSTLSSSSAVSPSTSNFIWSNTSTAPKLKEKYTKEKDTANDGVRIANNLKCGSVMDILGKKSDPLMDAWKPATGMWECSQCLIRNVKDEAHCVACKASKTIPKVDKSVENSTASSVTTMSLSKPIVADCFGSQFKMSGNQWECDACLVRNKQTDTKCVSCTTRRPGNIKAPPISSISNFSTSGKSDLMEKFKAPEGSWECPGCMLRNPGTVETCPCCNASKPGSLKVSPKRVPVDSKSSTSIPNSCNDGNSPKNELVDKSKSAQGFWECLNCKVKNPSSLSTCPCSSVKKAYLTNTTVSGFGDKFKKTEGAWTCDDCMLQNKGDTPECIACGAVKPGSKKITKSTSSSNSGSSLQFNFDMPENTGGFKFGIDKNEQKIEAGKPEIPASSFSFGAKTDSPKTTGFTFGVPLQNSTSFTFGVPITDKNNTELNNVAGENTATENVARKRSLNTEEPKNPPTFSFGVPKIEETKSDVKKFAFGAQPATIVSSGPSFSFVKTKTDSATDKSDDTPKVNFGIPNSDAPKLNFSSSTNEKPLAALASNQSYSLTTKLSDKVDNKPTVNPTFGTTNPATSTGGSKITTTATSFPTHGPFTFGSTTTNQPNASQAQSFGQNSAALPAASVPASVPAAAMFLFGSNKPANGTTTTAPSEKPPALPFGGSNGPAFSASNPTPLFEGNENKPVSAFGVAENVAPPLFGGAETKSAVFEAQDNKMMPFGNTKKPATAAFNPAAPTFSASSATPAFGSTTPAFGTAPTPTFGTNSTTSMFAASKPAENVPPAPTNTGLFGFGGNAAQPTPQSSTGFNFSANNPTPTPAQPPVQKNLFSFGNNSNTQQPGTGFGTANTFNAPVAPESSPAGFAFDVPKQDPPAFGQTAPITTPIFGAPQSTPSFGQSHATPAFGAPAPAPSSGFNFGGSTPAPTSGFNFGGQAPAVSPAGGFAFNVPIPSPGVAFDPNTRPTFNFTGGSAPSAFSATPQTTTQRKIKKAVRRTQPR